MITEKYLEIGPAYGRDYKNGRLAGEDFTAGKDFEMLSLGQGGKYCSIRDFAKGTPVNIRYNKLRNVRVYIV
jgi:hypothetical protein